MTLFRSRSKKKIRTKRRLRYKPPRAKGSTLQRKRLIEWVTELKKRPCADCKQLFPTPCMDFDHLPGHKKRFTISQFVRENGHLENAKALLEAEIAKCQVVCSNCHRIRTSRRAKGRAFKLW